MAESQQPSSTHGRTADESELIDFISHEDMQRLFQGGPRITKFQMVLHAGEIYKREDDGWHRYG
jgi:hypothetical protein